MIKILVVDDHDSVRQALCDWLALSLPNCRIFQAATGEQAIDLCLKQTPSIVLMDYGLPAMNGIEATRQIKKNLPQTCVIMISIHEDPSYQIEAAAAGVSHYVPKRTMQRELISILSELVRQLRRQKQIPAK